MSARAPGRRIAALALGLVGLILIAIVVGQARLSPGAALDALVTPLGLGDASPRDVAIVWTLRMPRLALAAVVGAALAVSGTALQGLVRNPLADPALVGVSSGAAVGAAAVLTLGGSMIATAPGWLAPLIVPAAAFAAGALVTVLVVAIGHRRGGAGLILAGVAFNALAGAAIGLLLFVADDAALRNFTFWTLGSVAGARFELVGVVAACVAIAMVGLSRRARELDTLSLGDAEARHVGIDVGRVTRWTTAWVALAVGAAVAAAGAIGFVGLAVPHLVRAWISPAHRIALPAAALAGAILVVAADTVARIVVDHREIPIGVVTALIGAPVLIRLALARPELA